jgi:hypothetical protein
MAAMHLRLIPTAVGIQFFTGAQGFSQAVCITQGKYDHLNIAWRPDMKQYKVVVLEEVPPTTPFDPPLVNASLTPQGGFVHQQADSYLSMMGGLLAAMHSGQGSGSFVCPVLGAFVMDSKQFRWGRGIALVLMELLSDLCRTTQLGSSTRCRWWLMRGISTGSGSSATQAA